MKHSLLLKRPRRCPNDCIMPKKCSLVQESLCLPYHLHHGSILVSRNQVVKLSSTTSGEGRQKRSFMKSFSNAHKTNSTSMIVEDEFGSFCSSDSSKKLKCVIM